MTREEIIALSPRELDAMVAEKIEGLPVVWSPDPFRVPDRRLTGRYPWLKKTVSDHDYDWAPVKRYATDWSVMKRVIEAMHERGWSCQLRSCLSNKPPNTGHVYYARFTRDDSLVRSGGDDSEMPGEDAPLAIARAALWAIEESSRPERQVVTSPGQSPTTLAEILAQIEA